MANVLVIHGPNLNLLGEREKEIYGEADLVQINSEIKKKALGLGHQIEAFQSNDEGEIVTQIQKAAENYKAIIINPAAFTHYSIAIRDAVAAIKIPVIEVHLSNIYAREEFRQKSIISAVASGVISGFGSQSYLLALEAVNSLIE
ncbi:MAG: type II 3-dehydroquinate dehydratase [Actinobacteria bacterium]|nr:MAG: type II 3-dehydroquinate dehydratase [Actinomycetota bacterium]